MLSCTFELRRGGGLVVNYNGREVRFMQRFIQPHPRTCRWLLMAADGC